MNQAIHRAQCDSADLEPIEERRAADRLFGECGQRYLSYRAVALTKAADLFLCRIHAT